MAPSYSSLFMGKFEEDKLNQYHRQPLIWLKLLDNIFLIWEHSEKELLDFIKYLNGPHPSIKFTYQYSTLRETAKRNVKMVPYVITYNPSLPRIGEIINK